MVSATILTLQAPVKHVTSGAVPFGPQGHKMNKLDRVPLDNLSLASRL